MSPAEGLHFSALVTAEVIPYQKQWKRITTIESLNCDLGSYSIQESYFSETPGFFAVIRDPRLGSLKLRSQCFSMPPVWFSCCDRHLSHTSLHALHFITLLVSL